MVAGRRRALIDGETAYAKINLALHVRERLPDGYHRIETIFAFCEDGDRLEVSTADALSLTVTGPFADALAGDGENLVLAAARMSGPSCGAAIRLDKRLPVAAGLGGGSADAGAAIRLLGRHWRVPIDEDLQRRAAVLGADVPACIVSRTRIGSGTGVDLSIPDMEDASGLPVLLVNPRVPLATGPVFRGWDGTDRGPLAVGSIMEAALSGRNDLEAPAIALCPPVADVLRALTDTRPTLARMSGSGATCFALYADTAARDDADARIAAARPGWWRMATRLR